MTTYSAAWVGLQMGAGIATLAWVLVASVVMVAIATWASTRSDINFFSRTFLASIDEENAVTLVSESDIFKVVRSNLLPKKPEQTLQLFIACVNGHYDRDGANSVMLVPVNLELRRWNRRTEDLWLRSGS